MSALTFSRLRAHLQERERVDGALIDVARAFQKMIERETEGITRPRGYRSETEAFPLPDWQIWRDNNPHGMFSAQVDISNDGRRIIFRACGENDDGYEKFGLPVAFLEDPDGYTRAFHQAAVALRERQQAQHEAAQRERERQTQERERAQLAQLLAEYGGQEQRS